MSTTESKTYCGLCLADVCSHTTTTLVALMAELAALQSALATEKAEHLETVKERDALKGITPELPPYPTNPVGSGLPRYGLRWNGPTTPLAVPMDDGYWTPWHVAHAQLPGSDRIIILKADYERLIASLPSGPRVVR